MEMITERNDSNRHAAADTTQRAVPFSTGQAEPFIARPDEILDDPALGTQQKRSILASWLSDKYAVPDAPRWRQLENGALVDTHDIWRALYALDDAEMSSRSGRILASRQPAQRRRQRLRWINAIRRRNRDDDGDDDDPPPAPAANRLPMRVNPFPQFDPAPAILLAA
jgi:hypothetical protein